jgi:hypothetical protein
MDKAIDAMELTGLQESSLRQYRVYDKQIDVTSLISLMWDMYMHMHMRKGDPRRACTRVLLQYRLNV